MTTTVQTTSSMQALVDAMKPFKVIEGIEIFSICDLDPHFEIIGYDQEVELLKLFTATFDASYYAACREDFALFHALQLAKAEGKSRVIVEDLS